MKKALTAMFSVFFMVALIAVPWMGPAEARSPQLDDNRLAQTPIALAADVCTSILGPFEAALDFFDLDVCPDMTGRVLAQPHIWNVFADDNWDADHPPGFSKAAINDLMRKIIDGTPGTNYLGKVGQYGVGAATFAGSSENDGCTGAPTGTTNQLSIELWITCEVQAPGTGVPYPDTNSLYFVFLPSNVDINNGPLDGTCDQFKAYHLQSMALTVEGPIIAVPPFRATFQSYPYAVIPLKCALDSAGVLQADLLTNLIAHELVEAVTDPISLGGWVDNTTLNLSLDFLKEGEAADMCQNNGPAPDTRQRRLDNGVTVAPYWSNADSACVPLLHTLTLNTVGLTNGGTAVVTSQAIFSDPFAHTAGLPKDYLMVDGVHAGWTFPTPVPGGTGVRYVTSNSGSGGPIVIDHDITATATYGKEFQLTVNTEPGSVQPLASLLTPSQWVSANSTIGINTNDFVPSGSDRYRFRFWTGAATDIFTATNVIMDMPKTATANYVLQHLVTFTQTGIPIGVPWMVKVRNVDHSGPYSEWFDEFSAVSFSFQTPVPALTAGTRYALVSTSTPTPLSVTANSTVTATYKTQQLLTIHTVGLPSPNLASITNGATVLGTANDSTPLGSWIDDGTLLSLAADANVNGIDGTQYFAQSFSPAPPATLIAPFETTMTYKTMAQLISDALQNGGLTGPNASGVGNALTQQFAAVQASMAAKQYAAALGQLTAFVDLVKAQCCAPSAGKALTTPTARTLQLDAMLVYHTALCLGSGQLSVKQQEQSYSYYSGIVSSLGGTVLARCP